jgi:hypothetical protein
MKMSLWKSLFFVAALGRADANAQQPAANTVDGHRLAAQKAAGLEFPGLLSRLGILGICGQDLWSGRCEKIGRRIKVATVVEMVQPLDCKREPITRSSTPGIDRSFPTDFAHRRCRKAN